MNVNKLCNRSAYDSRGNWYCTIGKSCPCEHSTTDKALWSMGSLNDKVQPLTKEAATDE